MEYYNIAEIVSHPGTYMEFHIPIGTCSEEYKYTKTLIVDNDGNVWDGGDLYTDEDIYMISDFQCEHGNYKYILTSNN